MLTTNERVIINDLRHRGYAVVIFTPDEVDTANPRRVEERLVELGNTDVLPELQGEYTKGCGG